jgi:DMSO/TMAO reductase YedYZ molybdopterin-dependent catalytic subunit
MTSPNRRSVLLLIAAVGIGAGAQAQPIGPDQVGVRGDVLRPLQLDRATLASFPAEDQVTSSVVRRVDGQERQTSIRGVRLRAAINRAGLAERDRLDWRKAVVIAIASDGYRAVFSWPELTNTDGGAQVLLLYERDGAPLAADEGPFALLAAADQRAGPRHVKWLASLEVHILRD